MNQYSGSDEDDESSVEGAAADDSEITEDLNNLALDDELYCVACNKFFNSESSKLNHEGSKKHKQNVELLKSEMMEEEEQFRQQPGEVDENRNPEVEEAEEEVKSEEDLDEKPVKSKGKKSKKKSKKVVNYEDDDELKIENGDVHVEDTEEVVTKLVSSEDEDWSNNKKGKKSKAKVKTKVDKVKDEAADEVEVTPIKPATESDKDDDETESSSVEHRCATCNEKFPSKNKLFNHLKKTNHSIYLKSEKVVKPTEVSKKKKK